jgi:hypothetical protein
MSQSPIGHTVVTTANDQYAVHTPGESIEVVDSMGLKRFKYIKYDSGTAPIAAAAGNIAYFFDGTDFNGYEVTSDVSETDVNHVAGVLQNVITDEYYGWIQTWGYYATVTTNGDDDIAAGDALIGVGDGTVNSVAQDTAPTNKVIGWAIADDVNADNDVAAYLVLE